MAKSTQVKKKKPGSIHFGNSSFCMFHRNAISSNSKQELQQKSAFYRETD